MTPNEMQIAVNNIGYDFLPRKQKNGKYRLECWFGNEKCLGLGKNEYKDWKVGLVETYKNFAIKFNLIK